MANSSPSFTVVTPSLNQSPWLRLCVNSVADQEGVTVQHIIRDAGSTDGTVEWIQADPRLAAVVQKDAGMYDALNCGFQQATGEIVAWLNCDEQYLPGALQRVAEVFARNPEVDMVFGDIVMVDRQGEYLWHRKVQVPRLYHTQTCHLSTLSCAMFFRRHLAASGRFPFDTSYRMVGDAEWMTRLLRARIRMLALGEFTSVFTQTGVNLSRDERAAAEQLRLAGEAPAWVRAGRPWWTAWHRLHRWWCGAYRQEPFNFSLYTLTSPDQRVDRRVLKPTFRPAA